MSDARRKVLLLGATGLVGRECLRLLSADPTVETIVVPVRRPLGIDVGSAKVRETVVNFDALAAQPELFKVDQIFSALGTTIKQAGSKSEFHRVDFDYPAAAARLGVAQGARHFLLVSAVGASSSSRLFYNRVKGELEDALRTLPYRSVTIVRPSLLVGNRKPARLGEQIGRRLGWIVLGKYRPIAASTVAAALVASARDDLPGLHIIESHHIRGLAEGRATH